MQSGRGWPKEGNKWAILGWGWGSNISQGPALGTAKQSYLRLLHREMTAEYTYTCTQTRSTRGGEAGEGGAREVDFPGPEPPNEPGTH